MRKRTSKRRIIMIMVSHCMNGPTPVASCMWLWPPLFLLLACGGSLPLLIACGWGTPSFLITCGGAPLPLLTGCCCAPCSNVDRLSLWAHFFPSCLWLWPASLPIASSCCDYPPSSCYIRYAAYYTAILDYMRENAKEKENEQERDNDKNGVMLPERARLPCFLHVVVAPLSFASGLLWWHPFLRLLLMVGAPFLSLLLVVVASFPRLLLDAVALSLFHCLL